MRKSRQNDHYFYAKINIFFRQINVFTKELISRKFLNVIDHISSDNFSTKISWNHLYHNLIYNVKRFHERFFIWENLFSKTNDFTEETLKFREISLLTLDWFHGSFYTFFQPSVYENSNLKFSHCVCFTMCTLWKNEKDSLTWKNFVKSIWYEWNWVGFTEFLSIVLSTLWYAQC